MRYAMFNAAPPDTTDESSRSVSLSCSRPRPEMPGCSIKTTGLPHHWHGTATPNHPHRRDRRQLHHRVEGALPHRGRCVHLRGQQDGRDPSHPRIPHAEVGARRARRARQLKFQIFLARIHKRARVRFILGMSPADVDRLSHAELKDLVLKLLGEVAELRRTVDAQRDEIARLKGGPGRPNIKPSGMEKATEPKAPKARDEP